MEQIGTQVNCNDMNTGKQRKQNQNGMKQDQNKAYTLQIYFDRFFRHTKNSSTHL